jgi:hypothetical protein
MEQRRDGRTGLKPVAVSSFLSDDWSPWIVLLRMRKRWPGLRFEMRAGYLEVVAKRAQHLENGSFIIDRRAEQVVLSLKFVYKNCRPNRGFGRQFLSR